MVGQYYIWYITSYHIDVPMDWLIRIRDSRLLEDNLTENMWFLNSNWSKKVEQQLLTHLWFVTWSFTLLRLTRATGTDKRGYETRSLWHLLTFLGWSRFIFSHFFTGSIISSLETWNSGAGSLFWDESASCSVTSSPAWSSSPFCEKHNKTIKTILQTKWQFHVK